MKSRRSARVTISPAGGAAGDLARSSAVDLSVFFSGSLGRSAHDDVLPMGRNQANRVDRRYRSHLDQFVPWDSSHNSASVQFMSALLTYLS
jgi:hypothetical protein